MNPEVKQEWLKALRSGKYEQGHRKLKKKTGAAFEYCCLGVLCDLAVKQKICKETTKNQDYFFNDVRYILPTSVFYWAGLDSCDPMVMTLDSEEVAHLTTLNDNGKSFTEIANLIEKYL